MRDVPQYSAEMVSQAIMGTPVKILQRGGEYNWPEVQTPDTYTGWVHKDAITAMDYDTYHAWNVAPKVVVTALTGIVHQEASKTSATVSDVVAGDMLRYLGKRGNFFKVAFPDGRTGYLSRKLAKEEDDWRQGISLSPEAILETAKSMLGFPYLWAGMSPKGFDCSGFVRTVLFMHDIIAPRDSGPQSRVGERIGPWQQLRKGDLVFFGRWDGENPRVSHVGFYLGNGQFIHSLGLVKIGSLDPQASDYDAYNAGRYLFGGRILPYIDKQDGLNTTLTNPYYNE
jgi:SH3-like domain-containing protein